MKAVGICGAEAFRDRNKNGDSGSYFDLRKAEVGTVRPFRNLRKGIAPGMYDCAIDLHNAGITGGVKRLRRLSKKR